MRKFLLFFLISFTAIYSLASISFEMLARKHHLAMVEEAEIMNESVEERFDLYLNSSHIIGIITANIFSNEDVLRDDYEMLGKTVIEKFHEILGFNLLDKNGKIVKVFPRVENVDALSKITQNFPKITESVKKGYAYWFSPPFNLYQGEVGFAFYVPIFKDKKLTGWIAPILSNKLFFERFKPAKYLTRYHLVVRDMESGRDYFSTSPLLAEKPQDLVQEETFIFGRKVTFYSWPKVPAFNYKMPWYLCGLIALIFSVFATYTYRLFDQRQETKNQLKKIKTLINFTANEASASLMGIYKELNLMGKETGYVSTDKVSKYISYIANLLDQISVSDKLNHPNQLLEFENNQVYPLLLEQIESFSDRMNDKNIKIKIDESPLIHNFEVWSNKWLLCHSVIGNILRNVLYYAPVNGEINITFIQNDEFKMISFYHSRDEAPGRDKIHDEILDRCLSIAREVLKIGHGQIDVIEKPTNGRTIVLKFSKNNKLKRATS